MYFCFTQVCCESQCLDAHAQKLTIAPEKRHKHYHVAEHALAFDDEAQHSFAVLHS